MRLGAVRGVFFCRVAGEGGEFGLEGRNVLVPAVGVGVLGNVWLLLDALEGLDVGLGRGITVDSESQPGGDEIVSGDVC